MNLSELIAAHKAGRSYRQLAKDCGDVLTSQRLQQIATTEPRSFPDTETIRGLARGLRVSESTVVLSVAESLGLDVKRGMPRLVEMLPAAAATISDRQAAAIAEVIRSFTEARQEGGGGDVDEAAPMNNAERAPGQRNQERALKQARQRAVNAGNDDLAARFDAELAALTAEPQAGQDPASERGA